MSRLSDRIEKIHKELCRELGIHPARIRYDDDLDVLGTYRNAEQTIRINMKRITEENLSLESVLAHETYHHYQYVSGILTPTHWRGKHRGLIKYQLNYSKWPWEISANRYANKQRKLKGWP